MNKYIFIFGKSSSGKDTITIRILNIKELNINKLNMYTTRPIRPNEVHGKDYYFIKESDLDTLRKEDKFFEERVFDTAYGKWYYATEKPSDENKVYITTCTVEQYKLIKANNKNIEELSIYLEVPGETRIERSINRIKQNKLNEKELVEICRRFIFDYNEFSNENLAEINNLIKIENIDLNKTIEQVKNIIIQFINKK